MSLPRHTGAVHRAGALLAVLILVNLIGCGSPVGPMLGRVRFEDGSPVQSGRIEFRRLSDGSRYVSRIAADGGFRPADSDGRNGLPPGKYEVVVVQIVLTEDLAAEDHDHGITVPRRYADYHTSDLRTEVEAGQVGQIELTLATE